MNKLKIMAIACLLFSTIIDLNAQFPNKYWVRFTDKNGSPYTVGNPSAYLSARSIARRTNQGIAINATDLPVNQSYINQVNATGAQVFQRSKWFNAAIVIVNSASQLTAINSLSCVAGSNPVGRYVKAVPDEPVTPVANSFKTKEATVAGYNYGPSITQVSQIGADCMHSYGYRGQNMMIAVIDAGYLNANTNQVFDSLYNEGRLLGTRDYVQGNTSVYEDYLHGANCLSLMAGNSPGNLIGTAPKASYWLLRSEDAATEKIIEENNWVVAAEFADSVGADITTTSLGYTEFDNSAQNHVYADLNGKTSVASIAATMAARKGIFVLNAAGNEGNNSWHYIGVPADADSICTVGSVNGSGGHSSFSSVGPTSDGRIKPDLSSMGENSYVCSPGYNFGTGSGTSYATPILAGAVACLWQANPTKTNMEILQALKATASKSSNPDNSYGWGIPNMCAAHNLMNGTTLGVHEITNSGNDQLFPNPAHNEINFNLSETPKEVLITDMLGKNTACVLTDNGAGKYKVSFSGNIANGVYFISIKTSQGLVNKRFVKQ